MGKLLPISPHIVVFDCDAIKTATTPPAGPSNDFSSFTSRYLTNPTFISPDFGQAQTKVENRGHDLLRGGDGMVMVKLGQASPAGELP
jgi:hypothetical protein